MIDLANVDFSLDVSPLGEQALAAAATQLFETWDRRLDAQLVVEDYSLYLEITEGSLKGRGKIAATIAAVYLGIGQFGSFVSGVREMARVARDGGAILVEEAQVRFGHQSISQIRSRKNAGRLGQLESLFAKVQRRELEPADAAEQAERLFPPDEEMPAGFIDSLRTAIYATPRNPVQLEMPFDDLPVDTLSEKSPIRSAPERDRQRPISPLPPPSLFRVEIRRESKRGVRSINVERL